MPHDGSPDGVVIRFGSDVEPGIRRSGTKRFVYVDESGRAANAIDVARIRGLAVPPAWTRVWIAADAESHLQATGRDARGRKQYRYHPAFTASRADHKFADLVQFGHRLGRSRRRVAHDLARPTLDHDLVVATVRLPDRRDKSAHRQRSIRPGQQVLRCHDAAQPTRRRARIDDSHRVPRCGSTIRIAFRGKSAQRFDVGVHNARLANIVRRCQHLPGQHLFKYRSADGSVRRVTSSDVNTYLAEHAAPGVTAKTFRTWNATVLAAERLAAASEHVETATIKVLNEVVDSVADHLGNTRAVCPNSYVHPAVVDSHLDATLLRQWARPTGKSPSGLTVAEHKTLRLLTRSRTRLPA